MISRSRASRSTVPAQAVRSRGWYSGLPGPRSISVTAACSLPARRLTARRGRPKATAATAWPASWAARRARSASVMLRLGFGRDDPDDPPVVAPAEGEQRQGRRLGRRNDGQEQGDDELGADDAVVPDLAAVALQGLRHRLLFGEVGGEVEPAVVDRHQEPVDEPLPLDTAACVELPAILVVRGAKDGPESSAQAVGVDDEPGLDDLPIELLHAIGDGRQAERQPFDGGDEQLRAVVLDVDDRGAVISDDDPDVLHAGAPSGRISPAIRS